MKAFREAPSDGSETAGIGAGVDLLNQPNAEPENGFVRIKTGIDDLDQVLGGGLVSGSVVLMGGAPGVGKSTLALQVAGRVAGAHYYSAEESAAQVKARAKRLGAGMPAQVVHTQSVADIAQTIAEHRPPLAVVDSIQLVGDDLTSFGSMKQLRLNAELLGQVARASGTCIICIGHVTKDGELAGPRVLEHLVDTVLTLTGDRTSELRLLRSPKNRFGSTLEVGVFTMNSSGLHPIENPAEHLLADRPEGATGSAITIIQEGNRSLPMEVQALTVKSHFGMPRRAATGLGLARLHVLLAVIEKFSPVGCGVHDVYVNVVGGLPITDRASDLAIVAAVLSSRLDMPVNANIALFGEIGLSGEVRSVQRASARIDEAQRLGFSSVFAPEASANVHCKSLRELVRKLFSKKG